MKRYKIDLSADDFFAGIKNNFIDRDTAFEVYEATDPVKASPKLKVTTPRKPRQAGLAPMVGKRPLPADQPDTTQRAFPWKDDSMNTPTGVEGLDPNVRRA